MLSLAPPAAAIHGTTLVIGYESISAAARNIMSSEKKIPERKCWLKKSDIGIEEEIGQQAQTKIIKGVLITYSSYFTHSERR